MCFFHFLGGVIPLGAGLSPCSCSGTCCVSTNSLGLVCVPSTVVLCWGSVVYCSPGGWELCWGFYTPRVLCPSRLCWDPRIETPSVLRTCCSSSESETLCMPCLVLDILHRRRTYLHLARHQTYLCLVRHRTYLHLARHLTYLRLARHLTHPHFVWHWRRWCVAWYWRLWRVAWHWRLRRVDWHRRHLHSVWCWTHLCSV